MDRQGLLSRGLTLTAAWHAIVALASRRATAEALDLLEAMPDWGLKADAKVYDALLKRLTADKDWNGALGLFAEAEVILYIKYKVHICITCQSYILVIALCMLCHRSKL
jgi:hypothetical protein